MKFVYFGYDFMLPSIQRLIVDGHDLRGIFSFPCDNIFNFNTEAQALAGRLNIPFIQSPVNAELLKDFQNQECDFYIAAGYPHRVPEIPNAKAINVHPTYLPHGRGMMPIPHLIKNETSEAAGFTAHKMTQSYDAGDILTQYKIDLSPTETVESYTAKIAVKAPDIISELIKNLDQHWQDATAQNKDKSSWFKMPNEEDRILDWTKPIKEIDKTARAFGCFGSIGKVEDTIWVIYDHDFWEEIHDFEPGSIAGKTSLEKVIAAKDGFFVMKRYDELAEN